jgi:Zn-dependent peptidase ImmA (M78 family)
MTRTPDAIIRPELLVWARQSSGYEIAAAATKLKVTEDRLRSWESGDARPTIAQLRNAAKAYKRPLAIFYLPAPPVDFQPLRDYRRVPDAQLGRLSPELLATIRRARAVRETAIDLSELADEPVASAPQLGRAGDPERFGAGARDLLGVTLEQQAAWRDPRRALNAWIDAVSRLEILVLQAQSIAFEEMRGFSISADRLPVIVLNGADTPRARIFTLLHEFAHVLMQADGVCDVAPQNWARGPTDEIEIFCNRAAAATLMPLAALRAEPELRDPPADGRWPEDKVRALSERYSVSPETLVRRLYSMQLTNWEFVQDKQAEYRAAYEAFREERQRLRQEGGRSGGPTFYRMKVRDLGRAYIASALDAYHRRAITGSDLSEFLEIKLPQVPKLGEGLAVAGGARD